MSTTSISPILRQKRPPASDGSCRDTARCLIRINGKKKYYALGLYGSPESVTAYDKLKAQFEVENVTSSDNRTSETLFSAYELEFLTGKLNDDQRHEKLAIAYARERFAPFFLSDFSMAHLVAYQNYLVTVAPEYRESNSNGKCHVTKRPWTRSYVNLIVKKMKRILAWGINNGMLSPMFRESVRLFPGITKANNRGLPERPRRESVRDCDVLVTLPYLTPTIADMVRIQRGACLRPSEVCSLRVGDLSFDSGLAVVCKQENKIERHGVHRNIAFGKAESEILQKRCHGRQPDEFIFSMKISMEEKFALSRAKRKTPLTPSQLKRDKDRSKTRLSRYRDYFTSDSYDKAVLSAVRKAMKENPDIQPWTPYQLRHASFSEVSERYGVDVASKVAGHLSPNLARVYDHSAAEVSQKVAQERCHGWWEN